MGFRFRKSVKILPGVRLTLGRRGVSASVGVPGARVSIGSDGKQRNTVGLPGTGLSYTEISGAQSRATSSGDSPSIVGATLGLIWSLLQLGALVAAVVAAVFFLS